MKSNKKGMNIHQHRFSDVKVTYCEGELTGTELLRNHATGMFLALMEVRERHANLIQKHLDENNANGFELDNDQMVCAFLAGQIEAIDIFVNTLNDAFNITRVNQ